MTQLVDHSAMSSLRLQASSQRSESTIGASAGSRLAGLIPVLGALWLGVFWALR
jgi:hypothetical protein